MLSVSADARPIEEDVLFWGATHKNQEYVQISMDDANISEKLNISLPVAFIIHGWFDSAHRTWVKSIVSEFLENIETNVVAVDWNRLALQEYTLAADSTKDVGLHIGAFIKKLNQLGVPLSNITIVGHSMGAHIAGFAGAHLNGKIGRIFGLDPAGPMFTKLTVKSEDERLDPSDAEFVQGKSYFMPFVMFYLLSLFHIVIHTDKTFIGTQIASGHQDFHPNVKLIFYCIMCVHSHVNL